MDDFKETVRKLKKYGAKFSRFSTKERKVLDRLMADNLRAKGETFDDYLEELRKKHGRD